MKRALRYAALLGLAGLSWHCGSRNDRMQPGVCDSTSDSLELVPAQLERGADLELTLRWQTNAAVLPPARATLTAGVEGEGIVGAVTVEVEVELGEPTPTGSGVLYEVTLANPFGVGTPAGAGSVLTQSATGSECYAAVSATTPFEVR